jgi:hypothetical protein
MTTQPVTNTFAAYATNAPGCAESAAAVLSAAGAAVVAGRATPTFAALAPAAGASPLASVWQQGAAAALGTPAATRGAAAQALPLLVAAAALAVRPAAAPGAAGDRSLAAAVAVGADAGLALLAALGAAQEAAGWAPLGAGGAIAVAVAAGRLLGLDTRAMVNAVGLAATQGAGLAALDDELSCAVVWGKAALNGAEAAALAAAGISAPATSLEGRRGLAALTAGRADLAEAILPLLGAGWPPARG